MKYNFSMKTSLLDIKLACYLVVYVIPSAAWACEVHIEAVKGVIAQNHVGIWAIVETSEKIDVVYAGNN